MNRDEILNAAQNNGNRGKEYERFFMLRKDYRAMCIGLLAGIFMVLVKLIFLKQMDTGLAGVIFLIYGLQSLQEGLNRKINLVLGIISLLMAVITILAFLGELI
ncbi:MAG: DUF6442 family protein [Lachnospiraceae bacterium]